MPKPSSLLAVLTPSEMRDFLPEPILRQVQTLAADFRRIDPTGMSHEAFVHELATTNPEILLACWKTPVLPATLPPRLRYLCYISGSVKKLVTRAHLENGLVVTNWGHAISRTVAECALLHILTCLRNTSYWAVAMHRPGQAAWKNGLTTTRSLFCRRVGLHGFGPVARELVTLLRPWGCPITAFSPDLTAEVAQTWGIAQAPSLETLFADNEIIVELAPLIPATVGLVDEPLLRLIRPGGVFVNVGRGAVVDESALLRVAREQKIAVGLDVYLEEPLPADHGFRELPHVSLTPHIAGPTIDRYPDAGAFAYKNLCAYREDQPLEALITPAIYDQTS